MKLAQVLNRALNSDDLSVEEGIFLLAHDQLNDVETIRQAADQLRLDLCGETVTYVVNRNLNFTNICEQHCHFCAFRRDAGDDGAFWLDNSQLQEKATDALARGATEICMQGGLNPQAKIDGRSLNYYLDLVTSLKTNFPSLHIHAFSPQEIEFIARQDGLSFTEVILALQKAGVGSLPGTAAEVLDDRIRRQICPEKLNTQTWLEIVETAHRLGMMTTSTMLCGHIETPRQQIEHFEQLRSLQKRTIQNNFPARISEFILLPFVGQDAPVVLRK
ncbi:MAG: CofH family radical SAM protein, partial [Limnothrix sp. RL_2_0]|nr:CofH family radical SAM protein [Limnothrix sp. RL_2_0]